MEVNEVFSLYATPFGGYRRTNLHGKGFYAAGGEHAHINTLELQFEVGCPYSINPFWAVTPYVIFIIVDNNPNKAAMVPPFGISSLTTTNIVLAIKTRYNF